MGLIATHVHYSAVTASTRMHLSESNPAQN